MQKVYLLLRDNRQTGPYSQEELVQMGLKPLDLIWVEGRSFGWSYPGEIEQLKPYAPPPEIDQNAKEERDDRMPRYSSEPEEASLTVKKAPQVKKIFVSMPGSTGKSVSAARQNTASDSLEQKAEELRRRAQAYAGERKEPSREHGIETKYSRPLSDVEEDFTSWMYTQKIVKKKTPLKKRWKQIGGILVVLTAAFFLIKETSRDEPSAIAVGKPKTEAAPAQSSAIIIVPEEEEQIINQPLAFEEPPVESSAKETPNAPKIRTPQTTHSPNTVSQPSIPPAAGTPLVKEAQPKTETNEPIAGIEKELPAEDVPVEKKKTLSQKIDGFFEKIKSRREERKTTGSATGPDGERKSTQRESAATTVDLTEFADVTSNDRSNDWMMGIQGLKLSLRNNSNLTIKSAGVEVRYYNDLNDLLEKKTVYFTDVPAKKSVTVPAPDHRLADHVDYKLISASGIDERYASQ